MGDNGITPGVSDHGHETHRFGGDFRVKFRVANQPHKLQIAAAQKNIHIDRLIQQTINHSITPTS